MGSKGLCPLFATGRGAKDEDVSCPVQLRVGTRVFPHLNLERRLAKPCASPSPYRTSRESPHKFRQALHRALFGAKQGLHPPPPAPFPAQAAPPAAGTVAAFYIDSISPWLPDSEKLGGGSSVLGSPSSRLWRGGTDAARCSRCPGGC